MTGLATRQMPILEQLENGACLTTEFLASELNLDRRAIAAACTRLITRGLILRRERGCFEISADGRRALQNGEVLTSGPNGQLCQTAPRRNRRTTARDVMWRVIRIARKFSIDEVQTLSGAERENARRYITALEKAGFLIRLRNEPGAALTSNGFRRWSLLNDPGPKPPIWRPRRGEVFDPNSGETFEVAA